MIGKWHLGSDPTGFDHWDILPGQGHYYNPTFINENGNYDVHGYVSDIITDLPLIENNKVVNPAVTPKDQEQFTTIFTEKTVEFIRRNRNHQIVGFRHPCIWPGRSNKGSRR